MLKTGRPQGFATAIPATVATDTPWLPPKVARVATVAVASLQQPAANDPTPATTTVQAMPPADSASTTVIDIGTVRPPGLTPKLLAASKALDAQTHAAGPLPGNDADRWCWPHSSAMTGSEIDTFTARLARFTAKGVSAPDAEALADKLVTRDRESDDRRLCLECTHLAGYSHSSWRCSNWQAACIAIRPRDTQLPADLVLQLQRCAGFASQLTTNPSRSQG